MYFVDNQNQLDPSVNIALETFLLKEKILDEPILLFYINEPSIIIGRNQNTIEEINSEYVEEKGIHIVRRMSGGGAVYHDLGNFSFCFITKDDGDSFRDFGKFTQPVIAFLHSVGVKDAELKGRNDLVIGDKKFSGNAMYATNGRMTAHGTILFDSDLDAVSSALKPRKDKIESKGIKSVRSRVTNIKPFVDEPYQKMTTEEFRDLMLLYIFAVDSREKVKEYHLTEEDWKRVYEIREEYFGNWDWNYGKSPKFEIEKHHRFTIGSIDVRLNVEDGHIQHLKIYGDFFGLGEIKDVEDAFIGVKYAKEDILAKLNEIDTKKYFGNVTPEELVEGLY
ncbi:bacterial lipoate protein ligase c-terminus [Trichococcus palustris]|uniref:lipoate--protein ligase n=1 Tax=Trichococcus palustris TaxID=140314 RepID=A0A143YIR5_9LACT|nr:lipoate--protein ligase [Trichococcus palustris]CZQ91626.1 bacterial lipoate protein ligase c-terminus [Trichococcus palustris]SFL03900.1 lipoate-protein ligase A [Trichococcus palustris]